MSIGSLKFDKNHLKGYYGLVGVDEVGRGALAGPVLASAAYVSSSFYKKKNLKDKAKLVQDSKLLTPAQRTEALNVINGWVDARELFVNWAVASVEEIETYNILGATRLAMERAIIALQQEVSLFAQDLVWGSPSCGDLFEQVEEEKTLLILIDGKPLKPFPFRHEGIISGDAKSFIIGVASIVAKVKRDQMMIEMHQEYPDYGFDRHKGYGTQYHRNAILSNGPSVIHRESFLSKILKADEGSQDKKLALLER